MAAVFPKRADCRYVFCMYFYVYLVFSVILNEVIFAEIPVR